MVIRALKKRWKWGILALGLIVGLELALRVLLGLGDPELFQKDDEIGYLVRADQNVKRFGNTIRINRYHQRSDDCGQLPAEGATRILVLGDSISHGGSSFSQEETYPELLKGELAKRLKRKVEVLNASAGSWGIGNELAYLKKFRTFGSHLVVLQTSSHDLIQAKSSSDAVGRNPSTPDSRPLCAITELFGRYLWPRTFGQSYRAPQPTQDKQARFEQNMVDLRELVSLARAGGADILVLHVPDMREIIKGQDFKKYDTWHKAFLAVCRDEKVPVLDLVTAWRSRGDGPMLYADTMHPNADGNRVIVDALATKIVTRLSSRDDRGG